MATTVRVDEGTLKRLKEEKLAREKGSLNETIDDVLDEVQDRRENRYDEIRHRLREVESRAEKNDHNIDVLKDRTDDLHGRLTRELDDE